MIEISFNKVVKNFGFKNVLDGINFDIKTKEKVAIIGDNGCGKTTIINLILKNEVPNSGIVSIRHESTIGVLRQDSYNDLYGMTVLDIINNSFEVQNNIKKQMDKLERKLICNPSYDVIEKYSNLQEKYLSSGGYEIKSKIDKIVSFFKIDNLLNKKYEVLSGGEKRIINLICLFLQKPDILILDEPTNHLDIDMLNYLEEYLINYDGTVLFVSHDRYFLDKVANKIILIENGHENIFYGNYTYYLKENENRILKEFLDYKNQEKMIEAMKKKIAKLREFGRLAYPLGEQFYKRAKSIEKRLEKIKLKQKPKNKNIIPISFNVEERTGNDVLIINDLSISYIDKIILKNASLDIYYKEKICIIGKNGCGKSSLIKEIVKKNNLNIKYGSNIKIGYISQDFSFEDDNLTVIEEALKYVNEEDHIIRSMLYKYNFYGNDVFKKISKLSFGERLRLKLFCLIKEHNNLLIFDEPTNHLDISTKEVLEEALIKFSGTLIVVSHDRYFIDKVANKIVYFDNNKLIKFDGNYTYFLKKMK